ncbi:clock-controlled protein-like protein 8 [Macroventuria anomochaeta]|uniref:Clock-controlled protein-like protein 8 n=1 Tax=Macroventuria anomochaeta TaxID=301207 RepID=A0ACB6S0B0_9PLEO|nr:clock-controlled protein-like protein 8 [Macroventuria anomochaeta]KAF2626634.1 clock-controlled protein-like protein 8 [Macroventuria anomochaeta]
MQEEQQRPPPPAYIQHEPESFQLPSVPTHAPNRQGNGRLPGIKALDLPDATARHTPRNSSELSPRWQTDGAQWGALPALHSATFPKVPDGHPVDIGSPMDTASVLSAQDEAARRRETSVSMDDPEVRLAAEALSGLGNPDFVRSPTAPSLTMSARESTAEPQQPMLSLLTSNHPWLGGTISGSLAAYNLTKDYSPRFVKYGAELVERNVGSPMVNTVSSVGRRTGMEKNLRRYLGEQHRRPSDLEQGDADAPRKRQRAGSPAADAMEIDSRTSSRTRGGSQSSCAESLPAYDDQRSPNYEENATMTDPSTTATAKEPERRQQSSAVQDRRVAWSTQLIMTTSGLGVALSAASLRSLKHCLHLLRGATSHIDSVMRALKLVLEEYETALRQRRASDADDKEEVKTGEGEEKEDEVRKIAEKIKTLSSDIWQTLQGVVQSVSRHTGGALPQNASQVVRTQLLSVPQRWQLAGRRTAGQPQDEEAGEGEAVRGANRMLAFAMEGLDMMGQITTVVDGTVQSAESWLARIGRAPPSRNGESSGEKRAIENQQNGNGYPRDEKR